MRGCSSLFDAFGGRFFIFLSVVLICFLFVRPPRTPVKYPSPLDEIIPIQTSKGCQLFSDGDVMCHVEDGDTCPMQVMFSDDLTALQKLPQECSFVGCKGLVFSEVNFESDYSGIHHPSRNKSVLHLNEKISGCDSKEMYYMTEPYPTDNWCHAYRPEKSDAFMCPLPEAQRKVFPSIGMVELDDSARFVGVQCGDRVNIHMRHVHDDTLSAQKRKRISEVFKDVEEKPCSSFGELSDQSADRNGKCHGISDTMGPPNVLILIIDTVSRNAFRRQAVHTMRFLKKYAGIDMMPSYPEVYEKEFLSKCGNCGEELGPTMEPIDSFHDEKDGDRSSRLGFDPNAIEWFNAWKFNIVGYCTYPTMNSFMGGLPPQELEKWIKRDGKRENLLDYFKSLGYVMGFAGLQSRHDWVDKTVHDHYYSFFKDVGLEDRSWTQFPRTGGTSLLFLLWVSSDSIC
jgi:hypothetical protein